MTCTVPTAYLSSMKPTRPYSNLCQLDCRLYPDFLLVCIFERAFTVFARIAVLLMKHSSESGDVAFSSILRYGTEKKIHLLGRHSLGLGDEEVELREGNDRQRAYLKDREERRTMAKMMLRTPRKSHQP